MLLLCAFFINQIPAIFLNSCFSIFPNLMKTFSFATIIATFLFIFYNGIQAQNIPNHVEFTKLQGIQKLDSIIYETWDTITNQWIFYY